MADLRVHPGTASGGERLPSPESLRADDCDLLVCFVGWSHPTVVFSGHDRVSDRYWVSGGSRLENPVDGQGFKIEQRGGLARGAYVLREDLPEIHWWARVPNRADLHTLQSWRRS